MFTVSLRSVARNFVAERYPYFIAEHRAYPFRGSPRTPELFAKGPCENFQTALPVICGDAVFAFGFIFFQTVPMCRFFAFGYINALPPETSRQVSRRSALLSNFPLSHKMNKKQRGEANVSFEENYGIRLVSKRAVDCFFVTAKRENAKVVKKILESTPFTVLNVSFFGDEICAVFCKSASLNCEIPCVEDFEKISTVKNATLFRFTSFGAAKIGAVGKIYRAAEENGGVILAVSQSDIGIAVCAIPDKIFDKRELSFDNVRR